MSGDPDMTNPYEEERQEKARRVIGLVELLRLITERLAYAATLRDGGQAMDIADDAVDRLAGLLNLCSPIAHRREKNGHFAFMWIETGNESVIDFRWIVCLPDGTFQQGIEQSQLACEKAVGKHLR